MPQRSLTAEKGRSRRVLLYWPNFKDLFVLHVSVY